jgi:hypothetical protein
MKDRVPAYRRLLDRSTLTRHRLLGIGVALWLLIELLLANRTAEVVSLALVFALPGGLLGLNVHTAHWVMVNSPFDGARKRNNDPEDGENARCLLSLGAGSAAQNYPFLGFSYLPTPSRFREASGPNPY